MPESSQAQGVLFQCCERLNVFHRSTYRVISRHLIAPQKAAARPVTIAFAEIRQHRQKRHTKRAGEAGSLARAVGAHGAAAN